MQSSAVWHVRPLLKTKTRSMEQTYPLRSVFSANCMLVVAALYIILSDLLTASLAIEALLAGSWPEVFTGAQLLCLLVASKHTV